jgi:hypothetical protein
LDILYVLPFVPTDKITETYESEILGRIDEMKQADINAFGSPTAEAKIHKFLADYVEKVWIGPRHGLQGRGLPLFSHKRWNHYFDCVSGDALTNNSSEGKLTLFLLMIFLQWAQ